MHFTLDVLPNTRKTFNRIIENTSLEDLNKIPKGFNNNVIWNIGHIVVTQQMLAYKLSGLPIMISDELVGKYRKDTKPEGAVTQEELDEIKALLFSTIEKTKADYSNGLFKNYQEYTVSTTGNTLTNIDEAFQFIMLHEGMHLGYVMALLRAIKG
ncbi:DinB superfamily protein [Mariniflexile rhizosphaerae]|uniref:DinB family protein n=1 Tax=unclassified Mariniflexile TaxID=2643887 RepID=UPI000CB6158B|nr:DinB family protein [Mariniflexile sp. TRM1-10]AXP80419.1 DinB superfamily protein [Mariniflexile sp. TRM1-10]PLB20562.1 MAG: DinB_2 domain containing protein [Flavobacteriaceae bacterium FS1-H7996/R]